MSKRIDIMPMPAPSADKGEEKRSATSRSETRISARLPQQATREKAQRAETVESEKLATLRQKLAVGATSSKSLHEGYGSQGAFFEARGRHQQSPSLEKNKPVSRATLGLESDDKSFHPLATPKPEVGAAKSDLGFLIDSESGESNPSLGLREASADDPFAKPNRDEAFVVTEDVEQKPVSKKPRLRRENSLPFLAPAELEEWLADVEETIDRDPSTKRVLYESKINQAGEHFDFADGLTKKLVASRRWLPLRRLGAGGMGAVYEGYDLNLKRKTALKILQNEDGTALPARALRRFEKEARSLAAMDSPYFVNVYDADWAKDGAFLAMDLIEGTSLDRQIPEDGMPWHQAVGAGLDMAHGLQDMHAAGVVHRDVKPANVMFSSKDGRYKIIDFGLMREVAGEEMAMKMLEEASKELLRGERDVDSLNLDKSDSDRLKKMVDELRLVPRSSARLEQGEVTADDADRADSVDLAQASRRAWIREQMLAILQQKEIAALGSVGVGANLKQALEQEVAQMRSHPALTHALREVDRKTWRQRLPSWLGGQKQFALAWERLESVEGGAELSQRINALADVLEQEEAQYLASQLRNASETGLASATGPDVGEAEIQTVATSLPDSSLQLTDAGSLVGTPYYVSPEQAQGEIVGTASDVWSLGVTFYTMLTNRLPFSADNAMAVLVKISQDEPLPLSNFRTDLPVAFTELIGRMLQKNAADRPTMKEVVAALEELKRAPNKKTGEIAVPAL